MEEAVIGLAASKELGDGGGVFWWQRLLPWAPFLCANGAVANGASGHRASGHI